VPGVGRDPEDQESPYRPAWAQRQAMGLPLEEEDDEDSIEE
jgi:hypothetical protein